MMNSCLVCPHLKYGSGCELAIDLEDDGDIRPIDDIFGPPPDWCPINNETVDIADTDEYPDDE
jgi:hypothetical protein